MRGKASKGIPVQQVATTGELIALRGTYGTSHKIVQVLSGWIRRSKSATNPTGRASNHFSSPPFFVERWHRIIALSSGEGDF